MAAEVSTGSGAAYCQHVVKEDDRPSRSRSSSYPADKSASISLITRDLLGLGCDRSLYECAREEEEEEEDEEAEEEVVELDLQAQVPSGWEKCLDLKSGKVFIQRCSSRLLPSKSDYHQGTQSANSPAPKLQDLNFPPSPSKLTLNCFDDAFLDLKLRALPSSTSSTYQSVCTLDKVKSALERAEREPMKKRSSLWRSSLSPSYSSSSCSIKESREDESDQTMSAGAAACPSCLLYVLISRSNPKCPRCDSLVPFPSIKKPRIDLNISI